MTDFDSGHIRRARCELHDDAARQARLYAKLGLERPCPNSRKNARVTAMLRMRNPDHGGAGTR